MMKKKQIIFVMLLGFVSLFSDMVYEGARSVAGSYLGILGASGAIIGFVFGLGEFIGYSLRFITGYFVDRTEKYWLFAFSGYLCNIVAIPLLALTENWEAATILFIIERVGKALRNPSRDAMISYASHKIGRGWGFGLHQMLDQLGGMLGPLIIASVLLFKNNYHLAFATLTIPALLTLLTLIIARVQYPNPQNLEVEVKVLSKKKLPSTFWVYLIGSSFIAAGFADYPLVAFHFQKTGVLSMIWIPIFYTFAMGSSAISTLFFGFIYDRAGCVVLVFAVLLSCTFAPLVFGGGFELALLGMVLWGVGMGAQRSLLKAVIGDIVAKSMRGLAYGLFNTGYGIAWFLGSWLMGILYDNSLPWLIVFSIVAQLSSIPFILWVHKNLRGL